ncbi:Mechanosensitive ion channel [Chitinophaga costaii]|uniref:Mechanosensitive ion channel n=1 Tax=Chitinophaga costaii TaxID=1335309 RepID=A0A1C4BKU2_9BACT|nr:mechanosensitive ion channel domain-containing protein [Chitinophaga costaii]PUZ27566.1 mechanosensitive ion channel protein [Chitinophaga costaii]SCC07529.1 Mechanosensitive ion channel [Chitinophaga costaii]
MKNFFLILVFAFLGMGVQAQDSAKWRKNADTSLFGASNAPSRSDYLDQFEDAFQTLNKVSLVTNSFIMTDAIQLHLLESDSAISILKDRLNSGDRGQNIRNLQMYNTLVDALDKSMTEYNASLDNYNDKLHTIKNQIRDMRKDSLVLKAFKDSSLHNQFSTQLQQLHIKWKRADSLMKVNTALINTLKAHVAANSIVLEELLYQTDGLLRTVSAKAFGKERRYIWETRSGTTGPGPVLKANFQKSVDAERKLTLYYFTNTRSKRFWLYFTGIIFYCWVWYNFRSLKKINRLASLDSLKLLYVNSRPIIATLLITLSLAPLFDLHAPAIYIEVTQFLLMLLVSVIIYKYLGKPLFYGWCVFLLLFLLLPIIRILGLPMFLMRWYNFVINIASILLGWYYLSRNASHLKAYWLFRWVVRFYMGLNVLALLCNVFGRVTLSQIFGSTAVYALSQTVSLGVFVRVVEEAFLLQIQASRIRKNYPEAFEVTEISRSLHRFSMALAIVLWIIVLTTNLNIYDGLSDILTSIFTARHVVGSLPFSLGGIVLFLGIIWVANFLQKYIAYFFGDTGDDAAFDDKGQRSRLLVTRLVLLVLGFLLAVAASGLPIDKITVVLGALSVGIGLGLQTIVNNFVSGVILIFDRPLRIGDTVEIGDKKGRVKEIGIRSSTLLTDDGAEVIMPNGDVLSHNIVNWTLSNNYARVVLPFTLDRSVEISNLKNELLGVVKANPGVVERKEPELVLGNVTSKNIEIRIFFWCKDFSRVSTTTGEVRTAIYQQLEKMNIEAE